MSSDERIEGRNLIEHGDFSGDWRTVWTVTGNPLAREDSATGKTYLQMTKGATITYTFPLPVRPDIDAVYWFSFAYEVRGNRPSQVRLTAGGGKVLFEESFLNRKNTADVDMSDNHPLVDLRPYEPFAIQGLERSETEVALLVTSADGATLDGIHVTDFKIDLRLVPLALRELWLDGRSIPVTA
jgi:hypothetical protein